MNREWHWERIGHGGLHCGHILVSWRTLSASELPQREKVIDFMDVSRNEAVKVQVCEVAASPDDIEQWTIYLASSQLDFPSLVCHPDAHTIYVAFGFNLYAIELSSGRPLWKHALEYPQGGVLLYPPGDSVLVYDELTMIRLDSRGQVIWTYDHSDVILGAYLERDRVVINGFDVEVVLRCEDGAVLRRGEAVS